MHGLPRNFDLPCIAQDQDRHQRRSVQQCLESFDALTIGQEQVHEHRGDGVVALPAQYLQSLATASDPFDSEQTAVRIREQFANDIGFGGIALDEKNILIYGLLALQNNRLC